jgi:hypothetical protein
VKDRDLDAALRDAPPPPPPAIGGELEAALGGLAPVTMRRPWRDFAKVAALSLVYGAALVGILHMRRDMHGVPVWWLVTYGIAWFTGFVALAAISIIPRRGSVMPSWRIAGLAAFLVSLGFVTMGLVMDPGCEASVCYTLDTIHRGHWCLEIGVGTAIVPVVLGALLLRGVLPVGSRWNAAGLGAAGGSLGGLVLHLHCPIADRWHLGLVHGGVVLVSALLAAALAPKIIDR